MKRLAITVSLLALPGCCPCGPPGEPMVDAVITLDFVPPADRYLLIEMLNAQGEHLTYSPWFTPDEFGMNFTYPMGNCDQSLQQSGSFTMRAWLTLSRDAKAPELTDPQGASLFDVTCRNSNGCIAGSDRISVAIAAP